MFIAADAGGTSTRAVVIDPAGDVLGYGRSGGGNPTSAGVDGAVAAIGAAVEAAVAGRAADELGAVVLAMAGERTAAFLARLDQRIGSLGSVVLQPDLLAMFHSGTPRLEGYGVVAGTGSIAARVRDGALHRVVGGKGWLLGDAGSGFAIGHRVARAVVAALDGQGPATALTPLVLAAVGIVEDEAEPGEPALRRLVSALYARRPVQLADFAPLAFAVPDDPVARAILTEAADALADLLATVWERGLDGPVVLGGSVLARGFLAGPVALRERLRLPAEVVTASDGVVGAAVLALRGAGITVDEPLFAHLRQQVADIAKDPAP